MKDFLEYKDWAKNNPRTGVTFSGECSKCGFKLENKEFAKGGGTLRLEGNGRKIARVYDMLYHLGEWFEGKEKLMCSECAPCLKENLDDV
jgi:hypothetical protein